MSTRNARAALQRIEQTQYGLFLTGQADAAGVGPATRQRLVARGEAVRIVRGLYRSTSHPVTQHQRILAAVLSHGPLADAAYTTAAWLFGVDGIRPGSVHIAVPDYSNQRSHLAEVHQLAGLSPDDRTTVAGIPCLSPETTLLMLAGRGRFSKEFVEDAFVDMWCRHLLDASSVLATLGRLGRSGRNGTVLVREIASRWDGSPRIGSVKEHQLVRELRKAGLEDVVLQHELRRPDGRLVARFDIAVPEWKVAIEYQSDRHHTTIKAQRSDYGRIQEALALGWTVVPASQDDIDDVTRLYAAVVGASLRRSA